MDVDRRRRRSRALDDNTIEVVVLAKNLDEAEAARIYEHVTTTLTCAECADALVGLVQSAGDIWVTVVPYGATVTCEGVDVCTIVVPTDDDDCTGYECDSAYIIVPAVVGGVALLVLLVSINMLIKRRRAMHAKVQVDDPSWARARPQPDEAEGHVSGQPYSGNYRGAGSQTYAY